MKTWLLLVTITIAHLTQSASCVSQKENETIKWKGAADEIEVVFIFKEHTTYDQRVRFSNSVFHRTKVDIPGHSLREGISDFMLGGLLTQCEAGAVEFFEFATMNQRKNLTAEIRNSEVIERVYENVIPNEIEDLPDYCLDESSEKQTP